MWKYEAREHEQASHFIGIIYLYYDDMCFFGVRWTDIVMCGVSMAFVANHSRSKRGLEFKFLIVSWRQWNANEKKNMQRHKITSIWFIVVSCFWQKLQSVFRQLALNLVFGANTKNGYVFLHGITFYLTQIWNGSWFGIQHRKHRLECRFKEAHMIFRQ